MSNHPTFFTLPVPPPKDLGLLGFTEIGSEEDEPLTAEELEMRRRRLQDPAQLSLDLGKDEEP